MKKSNAAKMVVSLAIGTGIGFSVAHANNSPASSALAENVGPDSTAMSTLDWVSISGPRGLVLANSEGSVYFVRRSAIDEASALIANTRKRDNRRVRTRTEIDPATGASVLIEENVPTIDASDVMELIPSTDIRLGLPSDVSMMSYCAALDAPITEADSAGDVDCLGEKDTTSYPSLEASG